MNQGHTAAEFRVKHMMVSWVRGHIKDVHGSIEFDPENPSELSLEAKLDARGLWSGETQRDAHLRTADFFDVDNHPFITFETTSSEKQGEMKYCLKGNLTVRGNRHPVVLQVDYIGSWKTPFYTEDGKEHAVQRVGFSGTTLINRHDFGVSWNGEMDKGGIVVGNEVHITLDIEGLLATEIPSTDQ